MMVMMMMAVALHPPPFSFCIDSCVCLLLLIDSTFIGRILKIANGGKSLTCLLNLFPFLFVPSFHFFFLLLSLQNCPPFSLFVSFSSSSLADCVAAGS